MYSFNVNGSDIGNLVEGFTMNATTGVLTEVSGSPFQNVTGDSGAFLQSGGYLFVRDQYNKAMSVYPVSTTTPGLSTPTAIVGWQTGSWPWAPSVVQ